MCKLWDFHACLLYSMTSSENCYFMPTSRGSNGPGLVVLSVPFSNRDWIGLN